MQTRSKVKRSRRPSSSASSARKRLPSATRGKRSAGTKRTPGRSSSPLKTVLAQHSAVSSRLRTRHLRMRAVTSTTNSPKKWKPMKKKKRTLSAGLLAYMAKKRAAAAGRTTTSTTRPKRPTRAAIARPAKSSGKKRRAQTRKPTTNPSTSTTEPPHTRVAYLY